MGACGGPAFRVAWESHGKHGEHGVHQPSAPGPDNCVTCWGFVISQIKASPTEDRNIVHIIIGWVLAERQGLPVVSSLLTLGAWGPMLSSAVLSLRYPPVPMTLSLWKDATTSPLLAEAVCRQDPKQLVHRASWAGERPPALGAPAAIVPTCATMRKQPCAAAAAHW